MPTKLFLRPIRALTMVFASGLVATSNAAWLARYQGNSPDPDSLAILQGIKTAALQRSKSYAYVKELSDTIGPRLTGSSQAVQSCVWAMQQMRRLGLQDVHLEPWRMTHSWERGVASATLELPFRLSLNIASYGWVGSTKKGGIEAEVTVVNSDAIPDEIRLHAKEWSGKVLFLVATGTKHVNPLRSFSQLGSLLKAAAKSHAVAVISSAGRPGSILTHTGPAAFQDSYFPIPVVDIAFEHEHLLQRLFAERKRVRMKIDVENSVSATSELSSNVVGDIPGSEHPEEMVIVGAHLDSWDLGTGSIDDGFGVGCVLGSAEAILSQNVRPKRTIRFVLFTGEEQGLLGSLAYTRQHKAELNNTLAAFIMDWGSGPITKLPLAGHDELETAIRHFCSLNEDLGVIAVDTSYLTFTDGYAFTLAGLPGIAALQNSINYPLVGHSAADTLDKVDRKALAINTAFLGSIGYWMANYPSRLGLRWNAETTQKYLSRDNQKVLLQLFGLWPRSASQK